MLTRRFVLAAPLIALPACGADNPLAALEVKSGGRLGVAVLDTGSDHKMAWRGDERFPMCSTFKVLLAAAVAARVDAGKETPSRLVPYGPKDLVAYSPVTEKHVSEGGMSVAALWDAILVESDNTAGNLLLGTIGGPPGWTIYARSLGDPVSRLDRLEPVLNSAEPGDERDTTTPLAMLRNLQKVLTGDVLTREYRTLLVRGMERSTLGAKRLRAGLPAGWTMGDKTGSGGNGTRNDVAIITPPGRPPILAAVYLTGSKLSDDDSNALIAEIGRMISGF